MTPPGADNVRDAVSQGHWDQAISLLQQFDPAVAADVMMEIPFEEQRVLFRIMPHDFAATLVSHFPYYHSYVLLHTRSIEHLRAIVNKMVPDERMQFFDQLPEEAWQRLMDELSGEYSPRPRRAGRPRAQFPSPPPRPNPSPRPCRLRSLFSSPTAGRSK